MSGIDTSYFTHQMPKGENVHQTQSIDYDNKNNPDDKIKKPFMNSIFTPNTIQSCAFQV